jgi:hypothetical protein
MAIVYIPAFIASSTPYWIRGLVRIGSISFGIDLVAGKKRVPYPAAGKRQILIEDFFFMDLFIMNLSFDYSDSWVVFC